MGATTRLQTTRLRSAVFSEFGLIHHRLEVEVAWLLALSDHPGISGDGPSLSGAAKERLQSLVAEILSSSRLSRIKDIEKETNHDVKALGVFLARRSSRKTRIWAALEGFIHFACTSWDANHPAYALMLDRARTEVVLPALERLEQEHSKHGPRICGYPDVVAHARPARLANHCRQGACGDGGPAPTPAGTALRKHALSWAR